MMRLLRELKDRETNGYLLPTAEFSDGNTLMTRHAASDKGFFFFLLFF